MTVSDLKEGMVVEFTRAPDGFTLDRYYFVTQTGIPEFRFRDSLTGRIVFGYMPELSRYAEFKEVR